MKLKNNMTAIVLVALLMSFGINAAAQKISFSPEALTIASGEEATVTMKYTLEEGKGYSSFSYYVVLPEGLSYVASETGKWATFGDKNPDHGTHAMVSSKNSQKLLLAMDNAEFKPLVDDSITIKVKADESLAASSQIKLTDIVFAIDDVQGVYCDDLTFDVTRGIPTAISGLEAGTAGTAEIYSLSGVRQRTFVKGHVNIIRNTNGKTAKVLSK